jgi:hypothetical protein
MQFKLRLLASLAIAWSVSIAPAISASIAEDFGAREPVTCSDTSAPSNGAITPVFDPVL